MFSDFFVSCRLDFNFWGNEKRWCIIVSIQENMLKIELSFICKNDSQKHMHGQPCNSIQCFHLLYYVFFSLFQVLFTADLRKFKEDTEKVRGFFSYWPTAYKTMLEHTAYITLTYITLLQPTTGPTTYITLLQPMTYITLLKAYGIHNSARAYDIHYYATVYDK